MVCGYIYINHYLNIGYKHKLRTGGPHLPQVLMDGILVVIGESPVDHLRLVGGIPTPLKKY